MTHSRPRKNYPSAVNHRTNSPKSPTTPITKTISKSPETHRIFTENDEIQLLKNLSDSKSNFSLLNGNFTEIQIAKKLKRLKEKYHKFARSKSLIKTSHDGEIYEIGRKIWGRNTSKGKEPLVLDLHENHEVSQIGRKNCDRKTSKEKEPLVLDLHENHEVSEIGRKNWDQNTATGKESLLDHEVSEIEEVNLDDFPFLLNEMTAIFRRNGYCKEGLRRLGKEKLKKMNEKWMQLKLEESELMVNKVQLYHEHLKLVVENS